jgi:hypothetical protein
VSSTDHEVAAHHDDDKLGQIAMRIISLAIVGGIITVFLAHWGDDPIEWFPFGGIGFGVAIALAVISWAVGEVK